MQRSPDRRSRAQAHRTRPQPRSDAAALRHQLRALVAAGVPGAVLLVKDGDEQLRVAAGTSDVATDAPMGPANRFKIGSITKTFVATVALQLVRDGRLRLADTVARWLPGLVPNGTHITVRQLLRHQSGLFDHFEDPRSTAPYLAGDLGYVWAPRALIALATSHPPNFPPGTSFSYSNTNYLVLGLIVERATGHSLSGARRHSSNLYKLHTGFSRLRFPDAIRRHRQGSETRGGVMRRRRYGASGWVRAAAVGVLAAAFAAFPGAASASGSSAGPPRHIFYIMMENHWYSQIIGNRRDAPFINRLAARSNLETGYYGVTHPSMPNYLAAISGSFQGIWDDCAAGASVTCPPEEFVPGSGDDTAGHYLTQAQIATASATPHLFPGANLIDQLESHHLTWRAYMQSIPSVGSQVEYAPTIQTSTGPVTVELYAQKHDPFMYFRDINHPGSARLQHIVPFAHRFAHALRTGNVPNFVWISPDQCHDMHGTDPASAALVGFPKCGYPNSGLDHGAIQLGDRFLRQTVGMITSSRVWKTSSSSIIITWDENDYSGFKGTPTSPRGRNGVILGGGHVPLIVLNSQGGGHRTVSTFANHYNLLATIQHEWHLGCLGATCGMGPSQLLTPLFD